MKPYLIAILLATGCATAHPKMSMDEAGLPAAEPSSTRIGRELQIMAIGAFPPVKLAPLVFGTVRLMDQIVKGASPTASGNVLCATAADLASWQTPASCGLAAGTNYWTISTRKLQGAGGQLELTDTTDEVRTMGWSNFPATATNVLRYQFGDAANGLQNASGEMVQLYAFHGIRIEGGRNSSTPPAAVTGGSGADPSLTIISSATGGGLRINSNGGSVGSSISFSGRQTVVTPTLSPAAPIAANSCAVLNTALTVTGAVANAECATSRPTGAAANPVVTCNVSSANTVQMQFCNVATGAVTPTTGTYSVRVFNP